MHIIAVIIIIVLGFPRAYHGHVVSLIDLSTYKLNNMKDGVHNKPDFVHVVSVAGDCKLCTLKEYDICLA